MGLLGCNLPIQSRQQTYEDIRNVDTTGLTEVEAEVAIREAENRARRTAWIDRERRKRMIGGGSGSR